MSRTHFELKYGAETLSNARVTAHQKIADFLEVSESAVPALVDLEIKVATPDPEKDKHIETPFVVTIFANVKHSVAKPI